MRAGHPASVLDQVRHGAAHLKRALGREWRERTLHRLALMDGWRGAPQDGNWRNLYVP